LTKTSHRKFIKQQSGREIGDTIVLNDLYDDLWKLFSDYQINGRIPKELVSIGKRLLLIRLSFGCVENG